MAELKDKSAKVERTRDRVKSTGEVRVVADHPKRQKRCERVILSGVSGRYVVNLLDESGVIVDSLSVDARADDGCAVTLDIKASVYQAEA